MEERCSKCGSSIKWVYNIPLLDWLRWELNWGTTCKEAYCKRCKRRVMPEYLCDDGTWRTIDDAYSYFHGDSEN